MTAMPNFKRIDAAVSRIDEAIAQRNRQPAEEGQSNIVLVNGADLKPEPVRWLWNGWLSLGKLHILAGAPGTGKTALVLAFAATVTCGGRWPDGSRCPPGNVLIWSGEDDPTDTLLPRLLAMGADVGRVYFIKAARVGNEVMPFNPARDLAALSAEAKRIGDVRLLMLDPVVSAIGGADSHKNTEVRQALQPVVDLAAAIDAAAVGISHFGKGSTGRDPVERVVGSVAFSAVARVVLAAAKCKADDGSERRIIARAKSNVGPDEGGFEYSIEQTDLAAHPGISTSRVAWGLAIEGTARELLAQAEDVGDGDGPGDAAEWLQDLLSHGPVGARDVKRHADEAGFAWRTVQRAMQRAGAKSRRIGFGKGTEWFLATNGATYAPLPPTSRTGAIGATGGANADDTGVV